MIFEERISYVEAEEYALDEDELATCEGLTDEQMERIELIQEEESADSELKKNCRSAMCPICLEAHSTSKLLCKLPCHHMFHYK